MVRKISSAQFSSAKQSAVALVDFSASWCGPCRSLAPVLERVSDTLGGKVAFYNVDVDDSPDLASAYGVQSIPCLVLMKNGQVVGKSVGFQPEAAIKSWIESKL